VAIFWCGFHDPVKKFLIISGKSFNFIFSAMIESEGKLNALIFESSCMFVVTAEKILLS